MPTTTSRRTLLQPIGSDGVSELRVAATALAAAVDGDVPYLSGTLSVRPLRPDPSVIAGLLYWATDTALLYEFNGTVWQTVMLAGGWTVLTMSSGFTANGGLDTPSARLEGDLVRLKGTMYRSGAAVANATWATLPSAVWPPVARTMAGFVQVETAGQLVVIPLSSGYVGLDGLTYSLS